ncbi:hypothetical protein LOTGIDRAFT_237998 [Lottia gigantea]|uniref:Integrator complex subunit 10 n=1 Tax=Lottia gigantea TaxID=225164 RepID=V4B4H1_LOTGI|nr:hypothetical protein LOTGIDRAFT_237998 [Lottia gigantea]ESP02366.1 hypothetical protein LOTGIDRAFT_237998 [Lottia gigantea]
MASSGDNSVLSDAEWLVMRARGYAKTDPWAAKAWLITARTLFPGSFLIQFESYQIEKAAKNIKDAASHLEDMLKNFQNEASLWNEVQSILGALQKETADSQSSFLTEIFAAIPTHVQCQMLLSVADKIGDVLERCRLLLLAMKKFPNLVVEHGLKLIEMLSIEESRARLSVVNCYRKLFVCDILPLVLQKNRPMTIPTIQLFIWLQRAVEFYISFITQPNTMDTPLSPDMMSPTKALSKKIINIPGLLERESQILDPWGNLFRLLQLVGTHAGWEMEPDVFTKSRDYQWQYLLSLYNRYKTGGITDEKRKQILYTCTILFLQCLYSYVSHVDADNFAGVFSSTGLTAPVVLLEGFRSDNDDTSSQPQVKRLRQDRSQPNIQPSASIHNSSNIIQNFLTAFKCFELLHSSDELRREFITLCQNWQMETWSWMGHFQTDMFLYQGLHQKAVAQIQNFILASKEKMKTRMSLQLSCCFYCLGNFSKACEVVMDTIEFLEMPSEIEEVKDNVVVSGQGRQLLLLQCLDNEILPYCIQLLITCIKEKAFSSLSNDMLLGHLLILLQYDWPKQDELFNDIIKKIRTQGSFTYNLFFHYVYCIDILEEFALLDTQEGGRVNLDIMSVSTKAISQQRTVTRGLNKGVKEDFRATLEKQVQNLGEPIPNVIHRFLKDERDLIIKNL